MAVEMAACCSRRRKRLLTHLNGSARTEGTGAGTGLKTTRSA